MKKERFNRKIEKLRRSFFLLGLVIALGSAYSALSYKTAQLFNRPLSGDAVIDIDNIVIPITIRPQEKRQEKKKLELNKLLAKASTDIFISVDDFVSIDDGDENPELDTVAETTEGADIEIYWPSLDRKPIYNGCEDLDSEEERFKCFQISLNTYVKNNFVHSQNTWGSKEKIVIHFVINKDGNVTEVNTARGEESDKRQLEKLILGLPQFVPAMYKGKYVKTSFVLPVVLRN